MNNLICPFCSAVLTKNYNNYNDLCPDKACKVKQRIEYNKILQCDFLFYAIKTIIKNNIKHEIKYYEIGNLHNVAYVEDFNIKKIKNFPTFEDARKYIKTFMLLF